MADDDHLPSSLYESLLTAIAYHGAEAAPILAVVTPEMFPGEIYRDIAYRIIDHRNRYKEPPAPAHLDDIFSHVLDDQDHKHYRAYTRILVGMREQARTLNVKYLVDRVSAFARSQNLATALVAAGERYSQGGEGRDDEVEEILSRAIKLRVDTLDYGEILSENPLSFLHREDIEEGSQVRTGIDLLDRRGLVPTRRELYYLMGNKKAGKTWWLHHLARRAARQGWNVVHISLENRTPLVKQRYVQSWLSVAKRNEPYILAEFRKDKEDRLDDIDYEVRKPRLTFDNPQQREDIIKQLGRWKKTMGRILVKEWPTRYLTIPILEHWLDGLEASEGFIPDMICLDYPQLMRLDPKDIRGSFGLVTQDLRRIAGERNLAMCAVMQSNRDGERAKILRLDHVAEDISQIATADTIITYNRTEAERRMGLSRLFVAGARNDLDGFTILVSQSYSVGQFHLDSVAMRGQSYWGMLDEVDEAASRENLGEERERGVYDEAEEAAE